MSQPSLAPCATILIGMAMFILGPILFPHPYGISVLVVGMLVAIFGSHMEDE